MKILLIISCFILSVNIIVAQQNSGTPLPPVKTSGAPVTMQKQETIQKPPVKITDGASKPAGNTHATVPVKTAATETTTPKNQADTAKSGPVQPFRKP